MRRTEDLAELAMMGKCVPVENEYEVRFITKYILKALQKDEALSLDIYKDHIHRYNNTIKVTNVGTCRVYNMPCIVYCLETQDDEPKPFETDYGSGYPCSFCYVFNIGAPDLSEFGDCFFEKRADGHYHRVS